MFFSNMLQIRLSEFEENIKKRFSLQIHSVFLEQRTSGQSNELLLPSALIEWNL